MRHAYLLVPVLMFVFTSVARPEDEKKSDKLPKVVAKTVKEAFPEGKIAGVEKEEKDDETVYDVKLKYKHGGLEVVLSPKGKILKVELKGNERDEEHGEKKAGKKEKEDDEKGEKKTKKHDKDDDEKGEKKAKKHDKDDDEKGEKKAKKHDKDDDEKGEKKAKKHDKDDEKGEKKAKKNKDNDDDERGEKKGKKKDKDVEREE